jgi:hypothetical protein
MKCNRNLQFVLMAANMFDSTNILGFIHLRHLS